MTFGRRQFLLSAGAGLMVSASSRSTPSFGSTDPIGVRDDFQATSEGVYLNTPYIGPPPRTVEAAGIDFIRSKSRAPISLGDMLEKTNEVRIRFASLFGARPEEVGFLFATSEGENVVAGALDLREGENVVVDDLHYTTTYVLYKTLEREKGVEVRVVRSVDGRADPEHFEPMVDRKTRLISVSWVSHQNGFRHDLKGLSELAHAHGALLYADGIQALGMFPTSLRDEGVDFMTSGTYKWLYASYGIAPFFISETHLERVAPDRLGALSVEEEGEGYSFRLYRSARKYEYATLAFGSLYQLGAALEYLERVGIDRIGEHTLALAAYLRKGLVERGFRVRTPEGNASAIVAFHHGSDPAEASRIFTGANVKISFREGGTQIRAGVAMFNNKEDVDLMLETSERLRTA